MNQNTPPTEQQTTPQDKALLEGAVTGDIFNMVIDGKIEVYCKDEYDDWWWGLGSEEPFHTDELIKWGATRVERVT